MFKILKTNQTLNLEAGGKLENLEIAYHTYGDIKKPVVWVCQALTGNSDVFDWWNGLFGEEFYFNPNEYFIICANVVGSCYGTTGPLSINPSTNKPYYHNFPLITIRDLVNAHEILRKHLGIEKIHTAIGSSLGGQQVLEWAIYKPELFENIIPIETNAQYSPWAIAFNESQRMAIRTDKTWKESHENAGKEGMKTARSIALLSYRHYAGYNSTQYEKTNSKYNDFKASSYQRYQGEKIAKRFNAFSYYSLLNTLDSHNVGRGRKNIETALKTIKAKTLVIGVSSDILFPTIEQKFLAKQIPNAQYKEIDSIFGHDGFLVEAIQLTNLIQNFYAST
ncbi:MAG: homoserine O-acetyltransferase [Chlorobi bacterium]|nr:homoserine O-acetyltransferase [Chlorobiota bacterium]